MNKKTSIMAMASIMLALALPLSVAIKSYLAVKTSPIIQIKIDAYDPRDLLRGHYLTFRYVWNWKENGQPVGRQNQTQSCLCVGEGTIEPEVALLPSCPVEEKPSECAHIIKGSYRGSGNFIPGMTRYYVGEDVALPLEKMLRVRIDEQRRNADGGAENIPRPPELFPPSFRMGLAVASNGTAIIEKLYIGDQTLDDYLRDHYDDLVIPQKQF